MKPKRRQCGKGASFPVTWLRSRRATHQSKPPNPGVNNDQPAVIRSVNAARGPWEMSQPLPAGSNRDKDSRKILGTFFDGKTKSYRGKAQVGSGLFSGFVSSLVGGIPCLAWFG